MVSGEKLQKTMTMNNVMPYHRDGSRDVNLLTTQFGESGYNVT